MDIFFPSSFFNWKKLSLLLQGKQGQRKVNWRVSESEKNGSAHLFDQVGVEEDHKLSEHHDSVPDEEVSDSASLML